MTTCCEDEENHRLDPATGELDCVSCGSTIEESKALIPKILETLAAINPDAILYEPRHVWDNAIVGITCRPMDQWDRSNDSPWVVVYDFERAVVGLVLSNGVTENDPNFPREIERVTEWILYNAMDQWVGPHTPTWSESPREMALSDELSQSKQRVAQLEERLQLGGESEQ